MLSDRPEDRFRPGATVHREGSDRPLTIASASAVADGPGWWLSFREIPSRSAAEALRDAYLEVAVDPAGDLEAGQAYWHDVIGCEVRATDGRALGRVEDVYRAGEAEVYVVAGGSAGGFDLPAVKGIVVDFAPGRGEIVVDAAALDLGGAPVDSPPPRDRRLPRWSRHGRGARADAPAGREPAEPETAEPETAGPETRDDEPESAG